jgi:signal transduction histidine kinase
VAAPLTSVTEISALVDHARVGGLDVELRTRGDLERVSSSVGVALYRVAQEALANAARHAPHARTKLDVEVADGLACLVAETKGPTFAGPPGDPGRRGYGLVGIRERASALGEEFAAGASWFDPGVAPRVLDRYRRVVAPARVTRHGSSCSPIASMTCCV